MVNPSALYYYITQGVLIGSLAGQFVRISAVSGGGGGSTGKLRSTRLQRHQQSQEDQAQDEV